MTILTGQVVTSYPRGSLGCILLTYNNHQAEVFTGQMPFLSSYQQHQCTEG